MGVFHSGRHRVLWFSRGRGRAHAVKDITIVERARRLRKDFEVRFVSYDMGAATFAQAGYDVINLCLPAVNPFLETLRRVGIAIQQMQPDLVVCHEEFAPILASKIFGSPALFITHWFWEPEDLVMQTLGYADEIIFIEEAGIFEEPPYVSGRVRYVGPVLRAFEYRKTDRMRAREELELPKDGTIISVLPGSWTEEMMPIADLVLPAYLTLDAPEKRLVWIAGPDCDRIRRTAKEHPDVLVKEVDWRLDRLMVASDVAITKANYTTIKELATLGIPSISLSRGLNPIDDIYARHIKTNLELNAMETNAEGLGVTLRSVLSSPGQQGSMAAQAPGIEVDGADGAAQRFAYHLGQMRARTRALHRPGFLAGPNRASPA